MTDTALQSDLIAFLQENGWKRQLSKDGRVVRFQMADPSLSKPVSIYFTPNSSEPGIERAQLDEALATIRQFYGISFGDLRHRFETLIRGGSRVGLHPRDLVTSRVPDRYVQDDTIEMSVASSMVAYMKELVSGAAIAEVVSTTDATSAVLRSAKGYVEECRFGHTFRGSFGFQVECPLYEAVQFDLFGVEKPLGRKISERIALAMAAVTDAFVQEDLSPLIHSPVSARMCSDLADFLEESGVASFNLGVFFDGGLAFQPPARTEFDVTAASVPMLREAAAQLEPVPADAPVNVVGRIVELKAAGIPLAEDDDHKRSIVIQWDAPEGRRRIRLDLDPHQYAEAIRAHEAGLHVQVRGTLTYKGKRAELVDATPLNVLD
ncbi:hypothetical protein TAL182_CH00105 [Rhizobium sp. TAL182]|uniref:hypothetical protein n=1 Tax=Rhizobium sp. TAL182 TaxID=2020313 RepID=UPI000A20FC67|nr:hypothetical protein [Rhizobium sp. TAL182]ARO21940.1 hypothetical protein TAL182_CH00105 [Rhizobium sp. TAL182]